MATILGLNLFGDGLERGRALRVAANLAIMAS